MRNVRRRVGLSVAIAWLAAGLPAGAAAQTGVAAASDAQKQAARDHYASGKSAFEAGRYEEAEQHFGESYSAVASPNTKLMLARSLVQLGRVGEAYAAYGETMSEARGSADAKYDAAAKAAEEERAGLSARVGMLKVRLSGQTEGASVAVQGRSVPREQLGEGVAVDPGELEVVVTRADGTTESRPVSIAAGQSAEVEIDATPLPAPEPAAAPLVDAAPEDDSAYLTDVADMGLVLGGKIGGGLGKPFSEFGASYVLDLEVGYMLPVLHKGIEIFVSGQYTQPETDGVEGARDDRLPGTLRYDITQQELSLTLGALYVIPVGLDWVAPYGGAGARLYMLRTKVTGSAGGESFGENRETQSDAGLLLLGGVDFRLGPGALLAELQFGWAHVDGFVLRDTNLGALQLLVGYRAML